MACILTLRMEKPNHTKKYGDIVQVHQHEWWYSSGSSTWIQFSILRFCKTSGNLRISLTLCYKHQNRSTIIHLKCNLQIFLLPKWSLCSEGCLHLLLVIGLYSRKVKEVGFSMVAVVAAEAVVVATVEFVVAVVLQLRGTFRISVTRKTNV